MQVLNFKIFPKLIVGTQILVKVNTSLLTFEYLSSEAFKSFFCVDLCLYIYIHHEND